MRLSALICSVAVVALGGILLITRNCDAAEGRIPISGGDTGCYLMPTGQSGSYIVTEDLTCSTTYPIKIQADNVTIDLDGHTVWSNTAAFYAIYSSGHTNIRITNGKVKGPGGIFLGGTTTGNYAVEDVSIETLDDSYFGIYVQGNFAVLDHNVVIGTGLDASTGSGILLASITGGIIRSNRVVGFGFGINLTNADNMIVESNIVEKNTSFGILFDVGSDFNTVRNNSVTDNYLTGSEVVGITVSDSSNNAILNNTISGNSGDGIYLIPGSTAANHNIITGNTIVCPLSTLESINVDGCGNIVTNNISVGGCPITWVTCTSDPNHLTGNYP